MLSFSNVLSTDQNFIHFPLLLERKEFESQDKSTLKKTIEILLNRNINGEIDFSLGSEIDHNNNCNLTFIVHIILC